EAEPTQTNIIIPTVDGLGAPTTITVPEKRGFDHLWIYMRQWGSGIGPGKVVDVPDTVYVDQLGPDSDLNTILP
ncbi:unnamed protein product, partial [marine sediment metagenome]